MKESFTDDSHGAIGTIERPIEEVARAYAELHLISVGLLPNVSGYAPEAVEAGISECRQALMLLCDGDHEAKADAFTKAYFELLAGAEKRNE